MGQPPEVEVTRYGNLPNYLKVCLLVLSTIGIALVISHAFSFSIGGQTLLSTAYYYLLFALFSSLAFLVLPARKKDKQARWYDLVAAALTFGISVYLFTHAWEISQVGWSPATPVNLALGLILCLLFLESGRRSGGPAYLAICIIVGLYPVYASHLPGVFFGPPTSFTETISFHAFSTSGLIGLPAKVMGEILIGFLIFAGILIASGGGKFFLNLALALLGKFRGGPAKVAVLASGFFGSLSGSVFSNIVATGSFTIPTMKRTGYPAHYAGAIEACASTGGVLMPPVMGAVAFIMCVFLGIDYSVVIIAAAIPAILYYWGLLMQVDAYAARVGLKGLALEEIPSLMKTLKGGWPFIAALAFLVWGLVYMRWAAMAPFYASAFLVVLSYCSRETMLTPRRIINTLVSISTLIIQTMAIIIPIGFVIAGLTVTGASAAFTAALVSLGGENILLLLVIGAVVCYLLGMIGLVTPAYIFLAVSLAPAVIQAGGLDELSVHLFIIYYAMLSGITPPVAIGAFLAASIAGANPMRTAFQSMRLGVVIYFIPFFFIFNPSLILRGPILDALYLFPLCLLGIMLIAAGMEGYLVKVGRVNLVARPVLVIAGLLIGFPEWKTTIAGAIIAAVVIIIIWLRRKAGSPADEIK